jgi:hypothetical protein
MRARSRVLIRGAPGGEVVSRLEAPWARRVLLGRSAFLAAGDVPATALGAGPGAVTSHDFHRASEGQSFRRAREGQSAEGSALRFERRHA